MPLVASVQFNNPKVAPLAVQRLVTLTLKEKSFKDNIVYCIKKLRNDAIASNLIPVNWAIQVLLDYLLCKALNGKRKYFEAPNYYL